MHGPSKGRTTSTMSLPLVSLTSLVAIGAVEDRQYILHIVFCQVAGPIKHADDIIINLLGKFPDNFIL